MRKEICILIVTVSLLTFFVAPTLYAACGNFWEKDNYLGSKLSVCNEEKATLGSWNDKISSYKIESGAECVITKDPNFTGECKYLKSGWSYPAMSTGWDNVVSSVKCYVSGYFTTVWVADKTGRFFDYYHYAGNFGTLNTSTHIGNLGSAWNDKISSIKIGKGLQCMFWQATNYSGGSIVVGPNQQIERLPPEMDNSIKSVICCECYSADCHITPP